LTKLLDHPPFGKRKDSSFLQEMSELCKFHLRWCSSYKSITGDFSASSVEEIPFIHVGAFKSISLITEAEGIEHQRTLLSSATTSGKSSMIALDKESSELQSRSVHSILGDFIGNAKRPLLVLDSPKSLRTRGVLSARIAAALSLQKFATSTSFLLNEINDFGSIELEKIEIALEDSDELIVYGFTWVLWSSWANSPQIEKIRDIVKGKRVTFVHSGGWKKLEEQKVSRKHFDETLLSSLDPNSRVIDYYGLVEQVGIIYPMCEYGFRHVPIWAEIIIRDSWTLEPLVQKIGQIQLLNLLAFGSPYHSVLTEDLGIIHDGNCQCGRSGNRFELIGRIPKAEIRGCANV